MLNLFNIQSGGISLLFLAFFEVITISWGYGTDRFVADIERMVGRKILPWWAFAWKYFSPAVILGKCGKMEFRKVLLISYFVLWNLTKEFNDVNV